MATFVRPVEVQQTSSPKSPEEALCVMFDLFEGAIEKMSPEKRKIWLDGLSEAAGTLEKRP
jgi:hypothetical protein